MGISATTQRLLRARLGYRAAAALTADVGGGIQAAYIAGVQGEPVWDAEVELWRIRYNWTRLGSDWSSEVVAGESTDTFMRLPPGHYLATLEVLWPSVPDPTSGPAVELFPYWGSGGVAVQAAAAVVPAGGNLAVASSTGAFDVAEQFFETPEDGTARLYLGMWADEEAELLPVNSVRARVYRLGDYAPEAP